MRLVTALRCAIVALAAGSFAGPTAASGGHNTLTDAEKRDGWVLLFDGRTTAGWRGFMRPDMEGLRWIVSDGCLGLPPGDASDTRGRRDIITERQFDDFELTWEWRVARAGNSGVKYFITEARQAAIGHEYQILDDDGHPDGRVSAKRRTAAFYDVLPARNTKPRPVGEFNQSRLLVHGSHVEHWLNGEKVLAYQLDTPELRAAIADSKFHDVAGFGTKIRGHILLQDHGDEVCYRNLKLREPRPDATSAGGR